MYYLVKFHYLFVFYLLNITLFTVICSLFVLCNFNIYDTIYHYCHIINFILYISIFTSISVLYH